MKLSDHELSKRVLVWHALSDLFTARELQDYDYQWMVKVLKESGLSKETIFQIIDDEVAPALLGNLLFNPTPVMDGWEPEEVKELVLRYLHKKPTIIEKILPRKSLIKKRRKNIQSELSQLSIELNKN
ncbi:MULTISPECIES: hypothetical protein [unclassified Brenneria]|uniref:DUF7079 family protein n=1 Tax=unclassified Brenneria TaxID=2634434 RepID=UPI0029C1159B|nr:MULTISPECIES: hypothetical protein [unclassified Brenneria]MDX5628202.1 hypothetical protein [Brenneria sp. L3-3Z]MDX5695615.1 hypothetical protein [Brenneria sp. L4-2C]MEE3662464.1 hypothetical protein [Brenneria sp. g21c3]